MPLPNRLGLVWALVLLPVVMGSPAASAGRGYEVAGPAGPSRDEALCRRLADALNAEPARELHAPRADSLFARWRPHQPADRYSFIEATRADILNEGRPRTVYRDTDPYAPYEPRQFMFFMRDDAEFLPQKDLAGPPVWAEAIQNGRLISLANLVYASHSASFERLLTRYPPFASVAGRRVGDINRGGYPDGVDLVLPGDGRVMMLVENTRERVAVLVELRGQQVSAICYLSGRRERRGNR